MTLFIACLLIYTSDLSGAWYVVSVILWTLHIAGNYVLTSASGQNALNRILENKPGIRGVVKND